MPRADWAQGPGKGVGPMPDSESFLWKPLEEKTYILRRTNSLKRSISSWPLIWLSFMFMVVLWWFEKDNNPNNFQQPKNSAVDFYLGLSENIPLIQFQLGRELVPSSLSHSHKAAERSQLKVFGFSSRQHPTTPDNDPTKRSQNIQRPIYSKTNVVIQKNFRNVLKPTS